MTATIHHGDCLDARADESRAQAKRQYELIMRLRYVEAFLGLTDDGCQEVS